MLYNLEKVQKDLQTAYRTNNENILHGDFHKIDERLSIIEKMLAVDCKENLYNIVSQIIEVAIDICYYNKLELSKILCNKSKNGLRYCLIILRAKQREVIGMRCEFKRQRRQIDNLEIKNENQRKISNLSDELNRINSKIEFLKNFFKTETKKDVKEL